MGGVGAALETSAKFQPLRFADGVWVGTFCTVLSVGEMKATTTTGKYKLVKSSAVCARRPTRVDRITVVMTTHLF